MTRVGRDSRYLAVLFLTQLACGQSAPGGLSLPGGPSLPSNPNFVVVCNPATLFVGQTGFCFALIQGTQTNLHEATWTSSDASVASFGPAGSLKGRSGGQIVVTASYRGKSESASVSVVAEDVLRVSSSTYQGLFRTGDSVMMGVGGFYGVASADSGELSLVITDQSGAIVSTSEPRVVARGGDSLVFWHTFTIPAGPTRLCRTAVLTVGSVTLTATGPADIFPCLDVRQ